MALTGPSFADDLIAVGHWQMDQQDIAGMEITFAFAPGQDELREVVLERAAPIVEAPAEAVPRAPVRGQLL